MSPADTSNPRPPTPEQAPPLRVAYVMSRFPKISETFILYEMEMVSAGGTAIELYPMLRERTDVMHPEAAAWVDRAHFQPFVSGAIVRANLAMARRRPRAYFGALWAMIAGTWGSLNFMVGGLGIFPKVVRAAVELERMGVDHVHCHFASHPALAGFLIHRLTGIPFSFTAHGSDLHVDRHMLPQKVDEAAFVVAISEDNRQLILDECSSTVHDPSARVHVVHCGVDTSVFAPIGPAGPRGRPDAPRRRALELLCVGTIHEVKGQVQLLEATRRLVADGVDVRTTFIGDGPDEDALRAAAADLGDRVVLRGRQPRPEVVAAIAAADILVAPSVPTAGGKREGIPVVLMEAMASGVPVVASRLSGIPELVRDDHSGVLVPPGDVDALVEALRGLAADPERRARLGAAARSHVMAEFDQRTNADRLVALINDSRAQRSRISGRR